jgi:hypothetical protein
MRGGTLLEGSGESKRFESDAKGNRKVAAYQLYGGSSVSCFPIRPVLY